MAARPRGVAAGSGPGPLRGALADGPAPCPGRGPRLGVGNGHPPRETFPTSSGRRVLRISEAFPFPAFWVFWLTKGHRRDRHPPAALPWVSVQAGGASGSTRTRRAPQPARAALLCVYLLPRGCAYISAPERGCGGRAGEYSLAHTRVQIGVAVRGCTRARSPVPHPRVPHQPQDRPEGLLPHPPRPAPPGSSGPAAVGSWLNSSGGGMLPGLLPPSLRCTARWRCLTGWLGLSSNHPCRHSPGGGKVIRPLSFFLPRGPKSSAGAGGHGCHRFSPPGLQAAPGFLPAGVLGES